MRVFLWFYSSLQKQLSVRWVSLLCIGLFAINHPIFSQLPSGFSKSLIQDGYTNPVGITFTDDGNQFFVWEKRGTVHVSKWNGNSYVRQSTPVLDIREEVGEWNDFGLHSICLDPNYKTNGLIYLFYVVDLHHLLYYGTPSYSSTSNMYRHATICRVTRYKLQESGSNLTTDYSSRKILLGETKETGVPVTFESHAGGTLVFGRDGTLFVSTGDGAHHDGIDVGSREETFYKEALSYGMMRSNENVGALRSQLVNSMCGKILRIDPNTGNGLPSNPFYNSGNPRSPESRMWAMGLRNPYRLTIQPNTGSTNPDDGNPGTLLVGDVGWFKFEDFHIIDKAGLNCGWPIYEGLEKTYVYYDYASEVKNLDEAGEPTFERLCVQPTSYLDDSNPKLRRFTHSRPALEYNHDSSNPSARVPAFSGTTAITRIIGSQGAPTGSPFFGLCVIGGCYYTGSQFPEAYKNTYFLADHSQGWIKNIELYSEGDQKISKVNNFSPESTGEAGILDLKMNPRDGSVYYVRLQGTISRISYGGNQPPVAEASANVTYGISPLPVQFTGDKSYDPEGKSLTYLWDFGDGTTSNQANPSHVFSANGPKKFTVTLVVTDDKGEASLTKEVIISLNNTPPTVEITNPAPGTLYTMSQATTYTLKANVIDTDLTDLTYEWEVLLHHNNHTHPEPILTEASPTITISPVGCSPNETYSYIISLKVTDNGGLSATHSVELFPDCNSASSLVSNLTATQQVGSIQLNWKNPDITFDEILVAAKAGAVFTDKPNGTNYTADSNFTGNGSPLDEGKVVYRGNGTNVTVTNLNSLYQYYFRVYTRVGDSWNGGLEVSSLPNLPPVAPTFTAPSAALLQMYNFTIPAFTDPEEQSLTYSASNLPSWLSFNPQTRVLSGLPTQTASYTITISATDPGNLTTSVPVVIEAKPNQAPIAPTIPTLTAAVNNPLSLTLPAFTDPEGQSLSYSASGLPSWLNFNSGNLVLSGTPTQIGNSSFSIKATDPSGLSTSLQITIEVQEIPFDLSVVLSINPNLVTGTGSVFMYLDVIELNKVATKGTIILRISKDLSISATFDSQATSIGDVLVNNSAWSFSENEDFYILTTNQTIPAGGRLVAGLLGNANNLGTSGTITISTFVDGSDGGEQKLNNNTDIEQIDYFPQ